jgi:hypothetical protein
MLLVVETALAGVVETALAGAEDSAQTLDQLTAHNGLVETPLLGML